MISQPLSDLAQEDFFDPGSFRDPGGAVFYRNDRVFRSITKRAAEDFRWVRDSGFLAEAVEKGLILGFKETPDPLIGQAEIAHVVEHPRIPFISYPYEWSFAARRAAALHHLDLQVFALDRDVALSDATAYNIQFIGAKPVHMDLLSLRRYREREYWVGRNQFIEQFLNPLLLDVYLGISPNAWFRGAMEGISIDAINALLPMRCKFNTKIFSHIIIPALFNRLLNRGAIKLSSKHLPSMSKESYRRQLLTLRRWIESMSPKGASHSLWKDYADGNTYNTAEREAKHRFISEFAGTVRPKMLFDFGCNSGEYTEAALAAGALAAIGFDTDPNALDAAFRRAADKDLNFLPLFTDVANPSPDQGWNGRERASLSRRGQVDAVLALALIHHLCIGRNVPMKQAVGWLVAIAPAGVIEFVQKSDPTVIRMLSFREDVADDYSEASFEAALSERALVVKRRVISESGRTLYWFMKKEEQS